MYFIQEDVFLKFVFYDQSRPPTHFLLKLKPIELDVPHRAFHVLPRDKGMGEIEGGHLKDDSGILSSGLSASILAI